MTSPLTATAAPPVPATPGIARAPRSSVPDLRLRRHADFQRVYNSTRKQHGKHISFFAARRDTPPVSADSTTSNPDGAATAAYTGPRIGLTVGRVMGKANVRNRIKRRLREAVRAHHAALAGLSIDVVLHPRRIVETLPFAELEAEVLAIFRRAARAAATSTPKDPGLPKSSTSKAGSSQPDPTKPGAAKHGPAKPGPAKPSAPAASAIGRNA